MSIPPSPEGSGIRRIRVLCREQGLGEPVIEVSESWVTTTFQRPTPEVGTRTGPKQESGTKSALSRHQVGTKSAPSRNSA